MTSDEVKILCRQLADAAGAISGNTDDLVSVKEGSPEVSSCLEEIRLNNLERAQNIVLLLTQALAALDAADGGTTGGEGD